MIDKLKEDLVKLQGEKECLCKANKVTGCSACPLNKTTIIYRNTAGVFYDICSLLNAIFDEVDEMGDEYLS